MAEKKEAKLKFYEGAKPGVAQKRKEANTKCDSKEKQKKYDSERERGFQSHWQIGRKWLNHDGNVMWCETCKLHYSKKSSHSSEISKMWITGTANFKTDTLKTHERSSMHKEAEKACDNRHNISDSEAGRALLQLNKAEYDHVSYCFRNAHAIAKHDKSFKDYTWLCKLDRAKNQTNSTTNQNEMAGRRFLTFIADEQKIITKENP